MTHRRPAAPPPPAPVYTFSDDFGGTALDLTKWERRFHHLIGSTAAWDAANSTVAGGVLSVAVKRTAATPLPAGTWSGDQINTKHVQLYGRFGVRARAAAGKGVFGAPAWMYASGAGFENEIDIAEIAGNLHLVHNTIHFPPNAKYPKGSLGHAFDTGVDLSAAFHNYEAAWIKPDATGLPQLIFYFDGRETWRVPDADRSLIPTHPMPLIVDNAVGGGWAGTPDATTPSPARMLVDRVWATA